MRRILYILFLLLLSLRAGAQAFDDEKLDSLAHVYYSLGDNDNNKVTVAIELCRFNYNVDSMEVWADRLLRLSEKQNNLLGKVRAYQTMGDCHYYKSEYEKALEFSFKALYVAELLGTPKLIGSSCNSVGDAYSYLSDYQKANDYYYRALDCFRIAEKSYNYIQTIYLLTDNLIIQKLFSQADSLLNEALELTKLESDATQKPLFSMLYENKCMLNYTKFIYHLSKPDLSLLEQVKDYGIMANEYHDQYYRGILYASHAMFLDWFYHDYGDVRRREIADSILMLDVKLKETVDYLGIDEDPEVNLNLVKRSMLGNDFKTARRILDSLAPIAPETDFEDDFRILDFCYYSLCGDHQNTIDALARFYECVNSSVSIDQAVSTAQNLAENGYKEQKKKREDELARNRRIATYIAIVFLLLLAFIVFEYFRKRRHNRALNEKNLILQSQKEEILQQKEEIQAQSDELFEKNNELAHSNRQITDSINYASLIQKAALPRPEDLSALFGKYFLIYRPLNIVAGDFYWASQVGRYSVFVCADCTGHGVPGAFVSMLGISLLNEVTANVSADTRASDILNELRAKLMRALGQSKRKYDNGAVYSMDGMDLAMVMIDYENMTLQFAGAYRPLWLWRKGELIQYKPDKMPIGLYLGPEKDFTNHVIEIQEGDALYMFSDGIPDQFGYTDDSHTSCKHFSSKRLASLLAEIGGDPLPQQKARIESEVDAWKNGYKQLDDNILIGIRI